MMSSNVDSYREKIQRIFQLLELVQRGDKKAKEELFNLLNEISNRCLHCSLDLTNIKLDIEYRYTSEEGYEIEIVRCPDVEISQSVIENIRKRKAVLLQKVSYYFSLESL